MPLDSVDSSVQPQRGGLNAAPATATQSSVTSTLSTELKHSRHRSSSWSATTFYSSTIVPAPLDSEALSSLISSLTSISDAQRAVAAGQRPKTGVGRKDNTGDLINRVATNPQFQRTFYEHKTPPRAASDPKDDDQDFCPPPVAGYNTINADILPARPKTANGGKPSRKFKDKKSLPNLKTKSPATLKPTSRELQSPDSIPSIPPRTSYGNESEASLPLSTNSKLSRTKSPFRMFFSQNAGNERTQPLDIIAPEDEPLEIPELIPEKEKERNLRFSAFVTLGKMSADTERRGSDTRTLSSVSLSNRPDLAENLIPSRRSSLRSGAKPSPRTSRDLKSLNIDQDLIEENHETVQRIRELQQAREKRHNEWRKEARKSEKNSKRVSAPSSNISPARRTTSTRSSWHAKLVETPEREEPPDLSTIPADSDPFVMASVADSSTAQEQTLHDPQTSTSRRTLSLTPSTTPSASSVRRHRQRLSDSLKRASSIRQPMPDDVKGVIDEVEALLASPRFTQRIRHPRTGRTIAFSEVGDPHGSVVICCVGMGLTRYVTSFYDEIAKAQKLRIITPDRPGVAETDAMSVERSTPLAWVDDVAVICSSLGIERFSLLAHSAGAIYALATALKMPQYVRGRIHLLGPWIPPSQLALSGQPGDVKPANLPTSHRLLSLLPASFMKAANSRFLAATSASIEPRTRKDKTKDRVNAADFLSEQDFLNDEASSFTVDMTKSYKSLLPTPDSSPRRKANRSLSAYQAESLRIHSPPLTPTPGTTQLNTLSPTPSAAGGRSLSSTPVPMHLRSLTPQAREKFYNETLTHRTWNLATLNANPAVDLVICLERRRPIGFRYTDITRAVVIHHGANDARVPLENARWLSRVMKRCELRVLENEGHGLMASASVMSNVLAEMGKEWDEWGRVARERDQKRIEEEKREEEYLRDREKGTRRGYPRW